MGLSTFQATCIIGAVLIIGTSWEKYQQPSIKGKKRYLYERFRPQLVTSNTRYYISMTGYTLLMLGLYALLVLVKDSQSVIGVLGFPEGSSAENFPLIAAMAIMGAQNLPYINKLETVVRTWCHAWAKVPRGIRQTRDEIANGSFSFNGYNDDAILNSEHLLNVDKDDFEKGRKVTTEWKWARISCVLFSLERARNNEAEGEQFSKGDFDDTLFEEYEDEYKQLLQSHRALGSAIKSFKERKRTDRDWIGSDDYRKLRESLHKDMGCLDEQLVSFVACAVRSKQATESQVRTSLAKLGFKFTDMRPAGISSDSTIIILAAIFFITVGTVIVSQTFIFTPAIEILRSNGKPIPTYAPREMLDALLWGLFVIAAHGAAIAGSHYTRRWSINRQIWPEWTGSQERARVSQYFYALLAGGITGTLVQFLFCIVHHKVIPTPTDAPIPQNGNEFLSMLVLVVIWGGAYCVTALFTAIHLDTTNDSKSNITKWSVFHALVALFVTYILGKVFIQQYHKIYNLENLYADIGNKFIIVTVFLVVLISTTMAILMPSLHIRNCKKDLECRQRAETRIKEEENAYAAELNGIGIEEESTS